MDDGEVVRLLKALADPKRFRMVQEIASAGELSCGQIAERFPLAQLTISHHLKILTDAGILADMRGRAANPARPCVRSLYGVEGDRPVQPLGDHVDGRPPVSSWVLDLRGWYGCCFEGRLSRGLESSRGAPISA